MRVQRLRLLVVGLLPVILSSCSADDQVGKLLEKAVPFKSAAFVPLKGSLIEHLTVLAIPVIVFSLIFIAKALPNGKWAEVIKWVWLDSAVAFGSMIIVEFHKMGLQLWPDDLTFNYVRKSLGFVIGNFTADANPATAFAFVAATKTLIAWHYGWEIVIILSFPIVMWWVVFSGSARPFVAWMGGYFTFAMFGRLYKVAVDMMAGFKPEGVVGSTLANMNSIYLMVIGFLAGVTMLSPLIIYFGLGMIGQNVDIKGKISGFFGDAGIGDELTAAWLINKFRSEPDTSTESSQTTGAPQSSGNGGGESDDGWVDATWRPVPPPPPGGGPVVVTPAPTKKRLPGPTDPNGDVAQATPPPQAPNTGKDKPSKVKAVGEGALKQAGNVAAVATTAAGAPEAAPVVKAAVDDAVQLVRERRDDGTIVYVSPDDPEIKRASKKIVDDNGGTIAHEGQIVFPPPTNAPDIKGGDA